MLSKTVDITLTPADLAREFCELDDDDQAYFFSSIDRLVSVREGGFSSFHKQVACIHSSKSLSPGGREVMRLIGEHSKEAKK